MTEENNTDAPVPQISPEIMDQIKKQIIEEMRADDKRKEEEDRQRQETQKKQHDDYVALMKNSPDPWVDIEGWAETDKGVRIELEWNDAFIAELRKQQISGADEEQMVQRWLALLMHDLSATPDNEGEFE